MVATCRGNVLDPSFASFVGRLRDPHASRDDARVNWRSSSGRRSASQWSSEWFRSKDGPETCCFQKRAFPGVPLLPTCPTWKVHSTTPGTCLFEGTNLSVGRGTERPFQWVGAPWLDGDALAQVVSEMRLPGVRIHPARFTPRGPGDGKFDGVEVNGVRLEVTEPETYDPTLTAVTLLVEARKMSGSQWGWNAVHFDRLAGTQQLRNGVEEGESAAQIMQGWAADVDEFRELRGRALLYE